MKSQEKYFVHPTAEIDEGCIVGSGTRIWHFCHFMGGAKIGENCTFGQNIFVADGVTVGDRVKVQNNVSLYKGVICKDDVFIGPSVVFTNVRRPRSFISQKESYADTLIEDGATIGANSTIVCGVSIGRFAFVGAGAVVTRDVPDHALVTGNPAKQVGWVSETANALEFDRNNVAVCKTSGEKYILQDSILKKIK